ncbi:MAG: type III pantothenate kinase [Candidatus Omnitrophica bacterium]|nr:type III pantothenate kinase [Candidatus Omnitrophota bacterium]
MIAVDIGNTNINFAYILGKKILKRTILPTKDVSLSNIKKIILKYPFDTIILCSVVPQVTEIFKKLNNKLYIVGEDIFVPLKCLYDKKQIGQDRLVVAFAANNLYKNVKIIIDFGTAITFDFLLNGTYQGGLILPGISSSIKTLSNCALLPKKINLKLTRAIIPKNTYNSISKGVIEGFVQMLNGLVEKYKKLLSLTIKDNIIITGGDVIYIKQYLNFKYIYDKDLIIKGLLLLQN